MRLRWELLIFLTGCCLAQSPDPGSIQKIEYLPQNCSRVEGKPEARKCKFVLVTFAAVMAENFKETTPPSGTFFTSVPPVHPEYGVVRFYFQPKDCKVLRGDLKGRFVCKNVWWEPEGKVSKLLWIPEWMREGQ